MSDKSLERLRQVIGRIANDDESGSRFLEEKWAKPSVPSAVIHHVVTLETSAHPSLRERGNEVVSNDVVRRSKSGSHVIPLSLGVLAALVDFLWIPTGLPPVAVGTFNAILIVILCLGFQA